MIGMGTVGTDGLDGSDGYGFWIYGTAISCVNGSSDDNLQWVSSQIQSDNAQKHSFH